MPGPYTVDDLVNQVRDQLDEANTEDVSNTDILQSLNRAQRKAANILARRYPDFFIASTDVTTTATDTYDVPEAAFGRRIEHVTVVRNQLEYKLDRISYRDIYRYTSTSTTAVPRVYAFKGRSYVVKPTPSSGLTLRLWYAAAPETMVLGQGRITSVNTASTYVLVDALGSDLTTSTDALGAFVNIVDAQTGKIKATLQINSLDTSTKRVNFKTSGLSRSSVYNRTIGTTLTSLGVTEDDYVCAIQGTCVPDLPDSCLDYTVQYAVTEIRRRMGEPVQDEAAALKALEDDIERQWAGRELVHRVRNKSRHWAR